MIDGKIEFNDLDGWLKTSVAISFILGVLYLIALLVGFIQGVIS
jgi:hypothetical protein